MVVGPFFIQQSIKIEGGLAEREELIRVHRESQSFELADEEIREIGKRTDGFSCCDLVGLAREAAFGPLRDLGDDDLMTMKASDVRPVNAKDFSEALEHVRSSVLSINRK